MSAFVGGVLELLGTSLMLHMFGVVAVACGIMFLIKAFSHYE